ncbi:MAG: response regulator [Candidatus Sumerlaeaceae bacterium]
MPKWRILIVDDEEDIRSVVRAALSTKYEVVEARDGLDALQKLDLSEPDFVVLDVMMPMMDGYQTCEAIRRHPKYKGLSVLFLSALNSREDMMRGYTAGANLYLTKPFDPSRLVRNVDVFFETTPVAFTRKNYTLAQLQELEKSGPKELADAQAQNSGLRAAVEQQAAAPAAPTAPSQAAAAAPAAATPTATKTVSSVRPRVLVVDDDSEILLLTHAILDNKFEVFTANDGIQAIEKITTFQPDIIVLDAMMPKMSGYQLCQSLRRNARFSKTPLLFISAKATPRDRDYAMRIGADAFLGKPFAAQEFENQVIELTKHPRFVLYPKALTIVQIQELENRRKRDLQEQKDRLHVKEENELEKFLREHTS